MARYAARDITTLVKSADAPEAKGDDASRHERIAALAQSMYAPPGEAAFSSSVLEALVRVGELLLIGAAGLALYFLNVVPKRGFEWPCLILIPAMAFGVVLVLQSLGLYRLGAFRRFFSGALRLIAGALRRFHHGLSCRAASQVRQSGGRILSSQLGSARRSPSCSLHALRLGCLPSIA